MRSSWISFAALLGLLSYTGAQGQSVPTSKGKGRFAALSFLEGTWDAKARRSDGVAVDGKYTFAPELGGTVLARHGTNSPNCHGPVTFDCEHGDLLYLYEDAPHQGLKAIYFDNEGHVIHYVVSTPSANTAVFQSEAGQPGPRFQLIYELRDGKLSGKFQMLMPGQSEWRSYLEWSGARLPADR